MAQERNPVDDSSTRETAEIRSEIERTRSEMSETIEEIQDRLRPDHLLQQAKDSVQEAAAGKVRTIMHTAGETAQIVADQTQRGAGQVAQYIRNHPVQTVLAAAAITWYFTRGRRSQWEYDEGYPSTQYGEGGDYAGTSRMQAVRDTVSEYADSARESARQVAGQARESAVRVAESVRSAASTASTRAGDAWGYTADTADRWMRENPMACGAAALAVGVAIGLSMPRTDYEDRTFGETRDNVMNRAKEKAGEIRDRVTEKVQSAADVVTDTIGGPATHTTLGTTNRT